MDDLISRQMAIEVLDYLTDFVCDKKFENEETLLFKKAVIEQLEQLPSAHPDFEEWCIDCKEYDHERKCCPRFNRVIKQTIDDLHAETEADMRP